MREVESPSAEAERHAAYRERERRNNIAMMAKRMMVLQIGHHGGLWLIEEAEHDKQHEVFRKMSRQAFSAATAFYEELAAFDAATPTTGHGEP